MQALTMFEATPRIEPETARLIFDLCERRHNDLEKKVHLHGCAITITFWQNAMVKEVTNEVDAQDTLRKLKIKLGDEAL